MAQFEITPAFELKADCTDLKVTVTHQSVDGKFLDVTFHDPRGDSIVTVPAEVWDMVVAAVEAKREF